MFQHNGKLSIQNLQKYSYVHWEQLYFGLCSKDLNRSCLKAFIKMPVFPIIFIWRFKAWRENGVQIYFEQCQIQKSIYLFFKAVTG